MAQVSLLIKGSFYRGVVFAKGCEFLLVSLGRGFGSGSGGWWVVSCAKWRKRGRGWGGWGGWGRHRQRNRQVNAQALSKLPFSDLPFSLKFSLKDAQWSLAIRNRWRTAIFSVIAMGEMIPLQKFLTIPRLRWKVASEWLCACGQNGVDLSICPCFACYHLGALLSNPGFY